MVHCSEGKENEVALQWAEMRMVRWMCGMKLQYTLRLNRGDAMDRIRWKKHIRDD